MKIVEIKYAFKGGVLIKIEFDSKKTGFVKLLKTQLDTKLPLGVQKKIIALIEKESYDWLMSKFYEQKRKRDEEDDLYLIHMYKERMAEAKELWKDIKSFLWKKAV